MEDMLRSHGKYAEPWDGRIPGQVGHKDTCNRLPYRNGWVDG
jgi:hypothetical protein